MYTCIIQELQITRAIREFCIIYLFSIVFIFCLFYCYKCLEIRIINIKSLLLKLFSNVGDGFIFKNGCHAPTMRQLYGDIAYIEAKPHDGPTLYVMANTAGYYIFQVKHSSNYI